jgi:hypothetical protein
MKKLLLILAIPTLFSCKKEEVKPQVQTSTTKTTPTTTSPFTNCDKDSSWTRSHPKTTSLYYFHETCTHITITFAVTKRVVTLLKPTIQSNSDINTNYPDYSKFRNNSDPNKFYYNLRYSDYFKCIIYEVEEANYIGVGGPGMVIK